MTDETTQAPAPDLDSQIRAAQIAQMNTVFGMRAETRGFLAAMENSQINGMDLWLGGIPKDFGQALVQVEHLLNVLGPRIPQQAPQST